MKVLPYTLHSYWNSFIMLPNIYYTSLNLIHDVITTHVMSYDIFSPFFLPSLQYTTEMFHFRPKREWGNLQQGRKVRAISSSQHTFTHIVNWNFTFNPLLNRLFLDHDIIFLYLDNIGKNQEKFKLSFEYF